MTEGSIIQEGDPITASATQPTRHSTQPSKSCWLNRPLGIEVLRRQRSEGGGQESPDFLYQVLGRRRVRLGTVQRGSASSFLEASYPGEHTGNTLRPVAIGGEQEMPGVDAPAIHGMLHASTATAGTIRTYQTTLCLHERDDARSGPRQPFAIGGLVDFKN